MNKTLEPTGRVLNFNILMGFTAKQCGVKYRDFVSDYRILCDCGLECSERFGLDIVTVMSDPMRETEGYGAKIVIPEDGIPYAPTPLIRTVLGCSLFYAMCDCFRLARFNTMLEQETAPYWKHFFTGVPAPGGCWMVLTPAMIALALNLKWSPSPYLGIFMLLFVGSLMASRLPTISLKHLHVRKSWLPFVLAALLLLVAFLVSNFWLTLGVLGLGYVVTVPLTGWVFLKVRARHLRDRGPGALDAFSAKV